MLTSISEWHDSIEKRLQYRKNTDRRNEYILFVTFGIICVLLFIRRITGVVLTTTEIGMILFVWAVWVFMLIAAVYQFPATIKDEIRT